MIPIKVKMKSGGEFRFVTTNPDGSIGDDTGWFPNLVTDVGLVNMTTVNSWANRFSVGSNAAPHSITDTALFNFIAASNETFADSETNLGAPNYQGQTTRRRRFAAGSIDNTVREVGISNTTNNTNMSILNSVTPEITVSDVQILDVFYRFTLWPTLTEGTGVTNIFGDDYDYTVLMGEVDAFERAFDNYRPGSIASVYDGDIGPITGLPSGNSDGATEINITAQGSGSCAYEVIFGVDDGNVAGGIRSLASLIFGTVGSSRLYIQVEFRNKGEGTGALDSTIPKDATRQITFNLIMTWQRH